jgi:tetratricopeptide (TPR) repeat protein
MKLTTYVCLLLASLLPAAADQRVPIDQVPMYGGMDRSKESSLRNADEDLIAKATELCGSREIASDVWFEHGRKFYLADDLQNAMRRFNQAWLLNPKSPKPFWGFAMVLHDQGHAIRAEEHMANAFALNLRTVEFLADYGRIATVCTVEDPNLSPQAKTAYLEKSEQMYRLAEEVAPTNAYLYESWATALYWCGDYYGAWRKVSLAEKYGGHLGAKFLGMLAKKLPRPTGL